MPQFNTVNLFDYGLIALYFGIVVAVGFYAARRNKTTEDYFKAGGSVPYERFAITLALHHFLVLRFGILRLLFNGKPLAKTVKPAPPLSLLSVASRPAVRTSSTSVGKSLSTATSTMSTWGTRTASMMWMTRLAPPSRRVRSGGRRKSSTEAFRVWGRYFPVRF